jgi:hypothetical protein
MNAWLNGFADELVKLASRPPDVLAAMEMAKAEDRAQPTNRRMLRSLRGQGAPVSRDYLASAIMGALSVPAMAVLGKAVSRKLNNRAILYAAKGSFGKARQGMLAEMQTGKLIGRARPDLKLGQRPLMTTGELAGSALTGGLGGSIVQMIRDRVSGSARTDGR